MTLHRHTYRVYFLRNFLPLIALIMVGFVVAWPSVKEFKEHQLSKLSITRAKIEGIAMTVPAAGQPAQLQVMKPEFTGRDDQGRPYVITAARVLQGMNMNMPMTLEQPVAKLTLKNETGEYVTLQGVSGVYDPGKQTLNMDKDIVLTHSDGYVMHAQDLFIDLTKGLSTTKTPVSGTGPMGAMSGESLELRDKGNHIILHGRSKVVLTPKQETKKPKDS